MNRRRILIEAAMPIFGVALLALGIVGILSPNFRPMRPACDPTVPVGTVCPPCAIPNKPEVVLKARLMQVLDGDSVLARVEFLDGHYANRVIAIRGIDAPEFGDLADCVGGHPEGPLYKLYGASITNLHRMLSTDVFFVVRPRRTAVVDDQLEAGVLLPQGNDVGMAQIAGGFARAYNGEGPRPNWCAIANAAWQEAHPHAD